MRKRFHFRREPCQSAKGVRYKVLESLTLPTAQMAACHEPRLPLQRFLNQHKTFHAIFIAFAIHSPIKMRKLMFFGGIWTQKISRWLWSCALTVHSLSVLSSNVNVAFSTGAASCSPSSDSESPSCFFTGGV